jgi:hypothetical protein
VLGRLIGMSSAISLDRRSEHKQTKAGRDGARAQPRKEKLSMKVAHVIGVSLGHTRSNPANIMNYVDRRLSRATVISFNNTAKIRVKLRYHD